jgi:Ca2+-binding RTX toxin-like protein
MATQIITMDAATETAFSTKFSTSYYTPTSTAYDITATSAVTAGYIESANSATETIDLSAAGSGGGFRVFTQLGDKTVSASQGDDFLYFNLQAHNADIYDSGGIDSLYIEVSPNGPAAVANGIEDFTAYVDTTGGTPFLTISYDTGNHLSAEPDARDSPEPTRIALETDMIEYLDLSDGTRVDLTQIRDTYVGASFSGSIELTAHVTDTNNGAFDMAHYVMPNMSDSDREIVNFHGNANDHVTLGTTPNSDNFKFHEGNDTITGSSSGDLVSAGADDDLISGAGGNDTIYGGADDDIIYGGTGNDVIRGEDIPGAILVSGNDIIYGGDGHDTINGDSGSDTLFGGDGNDIIDLLDGEGRVGRDLISGGAGTDQIAITGGDTIVGTAAEFVGDKHTRFDEVDLEDGISFVFTGHDASHLDGEIAEYANDIYDTPSSATFLLANLPGNSYTFAADYDTVSGDTTVTFEAVVNHTTGTAGADELFGSAIVNDAISGLAGDDSIDGGSGADTLYGDAGDDYVLGQVGADLLYGGADDDTLYGGEDEDTVFGEAGADLIYGNTGADVLSGGAGDDVLYGGQSDDSLEGGAGNDSIISGLGSDLVIGGTGNDTIIGDAAKLDGDTISGFELGDTIVVQGVDLSALDNTVIDDTIDLGGGQALTVSTASTDDQIYTASYDSGTGETTLSIAYSTQTGTAGDDTLSGTSGDDEISGLAGNDLIFGGLGDDSLSGGDGNDMLFGGVGADTMRGGDGESTLSGADGDDLLIGGAGADTIDGGTGVDRVSYDGSSAGVLVRLDLGIGFFGDAAGDVISNVENLSGSAHQDTLIGSTGANVIYGGDGHDFLVNFEDDDTLSGGAGDDTLFGILGDNTRFAFSANDGDDQIRFIATDGTDKIQLDGLTGISSFTDVSNVATTTGGSTLLDFGAEGSINLVGVSSVNSSMFEFS